MAVAVVVGALVCAEVWRDHDEVHGEIPLCGEFAMNQHDKKHAVGKR